MSALILYVWDIFCLCLLRYIFYSNKLSVWFENNIICGKFFIFLLLFFYGLFFPFISITKWIQSSNLTFWHAFFYKLAFSLIEWKKDSILHLIFIFKWWSIKFLHKSLPLFWFFSNKNSEHFKFRHVLKLNHTNMLLLKVFTNISIVLRTGPDRGSTPRNRRLWALPVRSLIWPSSGRNRRLDLQIVIEPFPNTVSPDRIRTNYCYFTPKLRNPKS